MSTTFWISSKERPYRYSVLNAVTVYMFYLLYLFLKQHKVYRLFILCVIWNQVIPISNQRYYISFWLDLEASQCGGHTVTWWGSWCFGITSCVDFSRLCWTWSFETNDDSNEEMEMFYWNQAWLSPRVNHWNTMIQLQNNCHKHPQSHCA